MDRGTIHGELFCLTSLTAELSSASMASIKTIVQEGTHRADHRRGSLGTSRVCRETIPAWCRALPRPEYKNLERVPVSDSWFEVYKVAPAVFAIYEPHQAEEIISYLIVGDKQAVLFDTGMGISDIRKVTAELTRLPIVVLNSHTHNDHVGDNWQFETIYGMDTDFTRENARGSREDAQAEVAPDQICGKLPKGFDPKDLRDPPLEDQDIPP